MKPTILIRKAWVAFLFGALFEFIYLGSEFPFVSITVDRIVALGLFAAGAGLGLSLDRYVSSRVGRSAGHVSETLERENTLTAV